jgi:hypothetical protein
VRAGIIQRHHRFWPVRVDDFTHPRVDDVECLLPRDPLEAVRAARAHTFQGCRQSFRPMNEVGRVVRHFFADDAAGERQRIRAPHLGDASTVDRYGQAAGVRAIEGANCGLLERCHRGVLRIGEATLTTHNTVRVAGHKSTLFLQSVVPPREPSDRSALVAACTMSGTAAIGIRLIRCLSRHRRGGRSLRTPHIGCSHLKEPLSSYLMGHELGSTIASCSAMRRVDPVLRRRQDATC